MKCLRASALWMALLLATGTLPSPAAEPDPRRDAVVEVVERVMPCVVNIATEEIVEYRDAFSDMLREFWGPYHRQRPRSTRYSLGSGVLIDEEGYVLTNLHVVQRASKVWVQLPDGREFEAQPLAGTSRLDVALLKLRAPKDARFKSIHFAKDDDLLLGETVLALGNPFGLGGSVSRGILSSKNRRPPLENAALQIEDWLQTDAAINPGSSGGPLVNLRGDLIGISVAVYREGQGIGFAIPVKQVSEALADILTPEVQSGLWFGARLRGAPGALSVLSIEGGSPADKAGLRVGDTVLQIGGQTPRGPIHAATLFGHPKNHEVTLALSRNNDRRTVTVRLQTLAERIRQRTGLTLQEMDDDIAAQFGLRPHQGLLVADVEANSPAATARLQAGHIVVGMGEQSTSDLLSASNAVSGKKPGDRLELSLLLPQRRGRVSQLVQATATLKLR